MRLILASTSPRRHELLSLLNIPFEIAAPTYVERLSRDLAAVDQVRRFAEGKAQSCASRYPDGLIIGCDTIIEVDSDVLGKPRDRVDAARMLTRLSGRQHLIHTAVALLSTASRDIRANVETVRVLFKILSPSDVETYLTTEESLGKAGAYAVQGRGADLIERIDGDYTAAVGLPLRSLAAMLRESSVAIPIDIDLLYRQKPYPNWGRWTSPNRA